jgi:hypothetical protein
MSITFFFFANSSILAQDVIWEDNFETNKGWVLSGEFEIDSPRGIGGSHGNVDPSAAFGGTKCLGSDLTGDGDYEPNLGDRADAAISPMINCLNYQNVSLNFQRYLGVEQKLYDHAYIDISANGTDWQNIWENDATITENDWSGQTFDISAYADGQATVQIRFSLGTTDGGWEYCGWNIDDFQITGDYNPIPTLYSYKTGDWNDTDTWTTDKSGRTRVGAALPGNGYRVVILEDRIVSLPQNVTESDLMVVIEEGAFLNMKGFKFNQTLVDLSGQGTLILESNNFPAADNTPFVQVGGGTTEYRLSQNKRLQTTQVEYNHLVINTDKQATLRHNLVVNGNLAIKKGKLRISNDTDQSRYQLTIKGNVELAKGAQWFVANGNTFGTDLSGGNTNAPFTDYYDKNTHRIIINGDFTNHGTVRFTNLDHPIYDNFPSQGAATVYFMGNSSNLLYCNGQTDFYNLVLDKGIDQSFSLTIHPTAYENFRLMGKNNAALEDNSSDKANPFIRKALWIKTGSLVLKGLTVIPSLTEGVNGSTDKSDFYIPGKASLVIDGSEVVVLSTADKFEEVIAAYGAGVGSGDMYGVNAGNGAQSFSVYGKLEINDGYFSTRESGGIITWAESAGKLLINGGILDTKQFRADETEGLSSYLQTEGEFILRGKYKRNTSGVTSVNDLKNAAIDLTENTIGLDDKKGTFNLNNEVNSFSMSGGSIEILNDCGGDYIFDIFALEKNISVTGGNIFIRPQAGNTDMILRSAAPFYNLTLENQNTASRNVILQDEGTATGHIEVKNKLHLKKGSLNAGVYNVTVGGDFVIEAQGNYSGTNTTIFNGENNQEWVNNRADVLAVNQLEVNKPADKVLTLGGSIGAYTVNNNTTLTLGRVNINGKTLNLKGNVINNGIFSGSGNVALNGTSLQTIGGNNNGQFNNLQLNNANQEIKLIANIQLNGNLEFVANKCLNIDKYELYLNNGASISGYSSSQFIKSAGNAGDGGLKVAADASSNFFPIGVNTYTPATIGFNTPPSTVGTLKVIPVNYEHTTTSTNNQALQYFWRVKSDGFTGVAAGSVTHSFVYTEDLVQGTENNYVPAVFYIDNTNQTFDWYQGTNTSVNIATNTFSDWISPSQSGDFLDGDYTAGQDNAFGRPEKFYSKTSGRWGDASTWSNTNHTTGSALREPGVGDIVIIGIDHTVSLDHLDDDYPQDHDVRECAILQIKSGATLDIKSNTSSSFGMVLSHPNGNGLFRVTTEKASNKKVPQFFKFPEGDFSDYNQNHGTTEFYDIDGTVAALYILPADVTEYGNLLLRASGGDNIVLPNNSKTVINGDLTCTGDQDKAWIAMSWNTNYWYYNYSEAYDPTIEKTVQVNGDLNINAGTFIFMADKAPQHLVVEGDINVEANGNIEVNKGYPFNILQNNTLTVGGSINNKNSIRLKNGNYYCDIFFNSENNAEVAGNGKYTFNKVTINKGSSQNNKVTFNSTGDLTVLNAKWLTLKNGTFRYNRNADISINEGAELSIPSTAAVEINTNNTVDIAINGSNEHDVLLGGKFLLEKGTVNIGNDEAVNNDIEYSGSGLSTLAIKDGTLNVGGQIRRNENMAGGVLNYNQSGGVLSIKGYNATKENAKFEILNEGSSFEMSAGKIQINRGGGTTFGDVYLRPEHSNVTGGSLEFVTIKDGGNQAFLMDATCPLFNLNITGLNNDRASVKLLVSPLQLNGSLSIDNLYSEFDVNDNMDIDVALKGDFINNGKYVSHNNKTTFNGIDQSISGSSELKFYNTEINAQGSVVPSKNISIGGNLSIQKGNLSCADHQVLLQGNLMNKASFTANSGGVVLLGDVQQDISGKGFYGNIELANPYGAKLLNDVIFEGDITLSQGVLDINTFLLSMGTASEFYGAPFSIDNMVMSDGVYSNIGILKSFPDLSSSQTFTYPLGVPGKYTPVDFTVDANDGVVKVRINNIDNRHPATMKPNNMLQYYWEVEEESANGFFGSIEFNYKDEDVKPNKDSDDTYFGGRLMTPRTSWSKDATVVDFDANKIRYEFSGADNLSGEYTAGEEFAIPNNIPEYTTINSGNWNDKDIWAQTGGDEFPVPAEGPKGFVVTIDHKVTMASDDISSYKTTINDTIVVDKDFSGHNLGNVYGNGTVVLQGGLLPEGRFGSFLSCSSNSTIVYSGDTDYTIVADLFTELANIVFTGSGVRNLPNTDLTICNRFLINDANVTVNNASNKSLTIKGSFERLAGTFNSGSGDNATVIFEGDSEQQIGGVLGDFDGVNALNNIEINNAKGLKLAENANIEVKGNLYLSNGVISTGENKTLNMVNIGENCVFPEGGSEQSYVNGPLTKKVNQGDGFNFPLGKDDVIGNKMSVLSTQSGASFFTAEYFNENASAANFDAPLTYVNADEYWKISAEAGKKAIVQIAWDAESDLTPLMCANGKSDMRVVEMNEVSGKWEEQASSAVGNNSLGQVKTTLRLVMPATGFFSVTTASINDIKPRAKMSPDGPICGAAGIPVSFTSAPALDYILEYTVNGMAKSVNIANTDYVIPTPEIGDYQLTTFQYENGAKLGVVDISVVTVYEVPTVANAGLDISDCGANSAQLDANSAGVYSGLWTLLSGTGRVDVPTDESSMFYGNNGDSYALEWRISNGGCYSADTVEVIFPLMAQTPSGFTVSKAAVCQNEKNVIYSVPAQSSVTYHWDYTGDFADISGSGNSILLSYNENATSGNVTVSVENSCNVSAPLNLAVTVNQAPKVQIVSDDSDNVICSGSTIQFTGSELAAPAVTNYEFFIDGTSLQDGASNQYSTDVLSSTHEVYVVGTSAQSCVGVSDTLTVKAAGQVWTGNTSSDWFQDANWGCGAVPDDLTDLIVPASSVRMPVISNANGVDARFRNVEIENTASVTLEGASALSVYGNWMNEGDLIANEGTVYFEGTTQLSGGSTLAFHNLSVNAGADLGLSAGNTTVSGNFVNGGSVDANGGTVTLNGTALQTLDGDFSTTNSFNNLTIDNLSGVELQNGTKRVEGQLELTNGLVTSNSLLVLGENATTNISAASPKQSSYVVGSLKKVMTGNTNSDFFFPVGSTESYKPAGIAELNGYGGTSVWEVIYNPNIAPSPIKAAEEILKVSNRESWTIRSNIGEAKVVLWWDKMNGTDLYVDPDYIGELRVAHLKDDEWVSYGNENPSGAGGEYGTITSSQTIVFDGLKSTNGPEEFTLGSTVDDNPLPVNLVSFQGVAGDNRVDLYWETASEFNNDYFEVQRSVDGVNFVAIGQVVGMGTTQEASAYSISDGHPNYGINYYRLRQVDFDGAVEIHKVISVEWYGEYGTMANAMVDFSLYPNPYKGGDLILEFNNAILNNAISTLTISDISGKILFRQALDMGNGRIELNTVLDNQLSKGVFFVSVETQNSKLTRKLIVK